MRVAFMQTRTTAPAASPSTQPAPENRTGEYVPVQGGAETRSGETLLVEAYIVLWVVLMAWLFFLWRKQARLHSRIDELEKVLDRAASSSTGEQKGPR